MEFLFSRSPVRSADRANVQRSRMVSDFSAELETGIDFTKVRPPGMDASCELVYDLLFHLHSDQLILGGFSQGAMVSTEVALNNPEDVHGLILLSGALLDQDNWSKKAPALNGKPFLQSHGTNDQVIPHAVGHKLYEILRAAGAEGPFFILRRRPRNSAPRAE